MKLDWMLRNIRSLIRDLRRLQTPTQPTMAQTFSAQLRNVPVVMKVRVICFSHVASSLWSIMIRLPSTTSFEPMTPICIIKIMQNISRKLQASVSVNSLNKLIHTSCLTAFRMTAISLFIHSQANNFPTMRKEPQKEIYDYALHPSELMLLFVHCSRLSSECFK